MEWVLLIFLHAGVLAHSNDVSITSVRFESKHACYEAGREVTNLTQGTVQDARYTCIHDVDDPKVPK